MGGAVPGWAPDEAQLRDPARRPIPEIIREVFSVYGRHAEPILILAALIEGSLALISLPYLVATVQVMLAVLDAMGAMFSEPLSVRGFEVIYDVFDRYRDPLIGASTGIATVAPLASALVMSGAIGALLVSDDPGQRTADGALRAVLRRWAALLLPVVALAAAAAIFSIWSYSLAMPAFDPRVYPPDFSNLWLSFAVSIGAPVVIGVGLYLVVRWFVVAPALVVEGIGLRAAVRRSASLTRGRRIHVAICLLAVGAIWSILSWVAILPAFLLVGLVESAGGGPLLAIPLALYVVGRIVLAPLLPILAVIVYRDTRATGPAAEPDGAMDAGAPPGWGSPG